MRLGIVGAGTIVAEFLAQCAPAVAGLEVVGIQGSPGSRARVRGLCDRHGIAVATDSFDELVAAGIDTVYVAVPNSLHFQVAAASLERGLDVIVEKPITSTVEEAMRLAELARARDLLLFEAVTTVHLPAYAAVREWLPRLGRITLVQSTYSQYSRRYDAFRRGEVLPAFDPAAAGGALMDLGVYNLHWVMGLFGAPAQATYAANVERGIDTSGILLMTYDSMVAAGVAAKDSAGPGGGLIQGTQGTLTTALPPNVVGDVTLTLRDGTVERFDDSAAPHRMVPEFRAFVRAASQRDLAARDAALDRSIAVSRVQTAARRAAGVSFPMDAVA